MHPIREDEKRLALQLARQNLTSYLEQGAQIGHTIHSPGLLQHRGSFVTIRRASGELRGCRGECRPLRPLIDSILAQTLNAAIDDRRFVPVELHELPDLAISISALTSLEPIRLSEIVLGRHGLVASHNGRSGLLLPEVPAHLGIRTSEDFLAALLRKAGLTLSQFRDGVVELRAFETVAWGEERVDQHRASSTL